MKKNIAIVESNILGTNTIRRRLASYLMEKGYNVTILANGTADEINLARSRGFHVIDLKASNQNISGVWQYLRNIKSALKQSEVDICLTFTIRSAIWGNIVTRQLKIPTITSITGIGPLFESNHFTYKAARIFYKFILRKTDKVFFQNKSDMNLFLDKKFVLPSKAQLVPGSGIDYDDYKPVHLEKANDKIIFLFISRLIKDKGILEFVAAARILKDRLPNAEFHVLGPLWVQNLKHNIVTQKELDSWINEGLIKYAGYADDVRPFIANADCIVLPSYREGLSNVLLEAGSMEKPCITCDVPGCNDIIIHNITGFLCEAKNAKDLSDKIRKMYALTSDQRKQMGKLARERIIKNFDKKIVLEAYAKAIEDININ
jgi:glycosyltransferase involved in cell wall biosynthesis